MRELKVHKLHRMLRRGWSECGLVVWMKSGPRGEYWPLRGTHDWHNVTCKRCLAKRPGG